MGAQGTYARKAELLKQRLSLGVSPRSPRLWRSLSLRTSEQRPVLGSLGTESRSTHSGLPRTSPQVSRTSRPAQTWAAHDQQALFLGPATETKEGGTEERGKARKAGRMEHLFSWNFGGCTLVLYIFFIVRQDHTC